MVKLWPLQPFFPAQSFLADLQEPWPLQLFTPSHLILSSFDPLSAAKAWLAPSANSPATAAAIAAFLLRAIDVDPTDPRPCMGRVACIVTHCAPGESEAGAEIRRARAARRPGWPGRRAAPHSRTPPARTDPRENQPGLAERSRVRPSSRR